MTRVGAVLRREMLEQARQPWMLASIAALMGLVAAAAPIATAALTWVVTYAGEDLLAALLPAADPAALVGTFHTTGLFLGFTQYLGIAAVMAGHGVLHDRQCGTFSFLLLAPISRRDLLLGKILGALSWPTLAYAATTGLGATVTFAFPLARDAVPEALPAAPVFWVALLLGGPSWAAFAGAICASISALARDVRTAQQGTWFVVFFAALVAGSLLVWGLGQGVLAELGVAAVAACGAALAVSVGAQLLGRDLAR